MSNPELKDAVWQVLEEFSRHQESGGSLHSDLIIRKFPQVNEIELINAVGELVEDGKITVKAATVDAHGNATAYHIHVREEDERSKTPSAPPRSGIAESSVGFGPGSAPAPPEKPRTDDDEPVRQAGRVSVGFDASEAPPEAPPRSEIRSDASRQAEPPKDSSIAMQQEAEQNFADEVASFFAELEMADMSDPEAKRELSEQLMLLMAMFQSADPSNFTTPINKLAALKTRVQRVAPELVNDFVLLAQTGLRAWLGRV